MHIYIYIVYIYIVYIYTYIHIYIYIYFNQTYWSVACGVDWSIAYLNTKWVDWISKYTLQPKPECPVSLSISKFMSISGCMKVSIYMHIER